MAKRLNVPLFAAFGVTGYGTWVTLADNPVIAKRC